MPLIIEDAIKDNLKLRLALCGPEGSGKTFTGLRLATAIAAREGKPVAVIDTEHRASLRNANHFKFKIISLSEFHPLNYVEAIHLAEKTGCGVCIIDSLSHEWNGLGGALDLVERGAASRAGNSFSAWEEVTPLHNQLIEAMLASSMHIIATMRVKTAYVMEETIERGRKKTQVRKVGLAPIQRKGIEYEFDVVGNLTPENQMVITKSRCPELIGKTYYQAGEGVADILWNWLSSEGDISATRPGEGSQPETGTVIPTAARVASGAATIVSAITAGSGLMPVSVITPLKVPGGKPKILLASATPSRDQQAALELAAFEVVIRKGREEGNAAPAGLYPVDEEAFKTRLAGLTGGMEPREVATLMGYSSISEMLIATKEILAGEGLELIHYGQGQKLALALEIINRWLEFNRPGMANPPVTTKPSMFTEKAG